MAHGILLSNVTRKVTTTFANRIISSRESNSVIKDGTVLELIEPSQEVSTVDGSVYMSAKVQVRPGKAITVFGYGQEQIDQLRVLVPGDPFSALLDPIGTDGGRFKLVEFEPPTEAPADQPAV